MKGLQDWSGGSIIGSIGNNTAKTVLDFLQALDSIFWKSKEKAIAVVKTRVDERVSKSSSGVQS